MFTYILPGLIYNTHKLDFRKLYILLPYIFVSTQGFQSGLAPSDLSRDCSDKIVGSNFVSQNKIKNRKN